MFSRLFGRLFGRPVDPTDGQWIIIRLFLVTHSVRHTHTRTHTHTHTHTQTDGQPSQATASINEKPNLEIFAVSGRHWAPRRRPETARDKCDRPRRCFWSANVRVGDRGQKNEAKKKRTPAMVDAAITVDPRKVATDRQQEIDAAGGRELRPSNSLEMMVASHPQIGGSERSQARGRNEKEAAERDDAQLLGGGVQFDTRSNQLRQEKKRKPRKTADIQVHISVHPCYAP